MAGHRRGDAPEGFLAPATPGRSPRDPRPAPAQSPRTRTASRSAGTAERRRLSPPNSSTSMPNRSSVSRCAASAWRCAGRQVDQQRRQQPLALEPSGRQPLGDLLEQHPLVRHVLIDDRDPLVVDGDDEGVAELAERNHRAGRRRRSRPAVWPRRPPRSPAADSLPGLRRRPGWHERRAARRRAPDSSGCRSLRRPGRLGSSSAAALRRGPTDGRQLQLRRAPLPQRVAETAPQDLVDQRLLAGTAPRPSSDGR